MRYFLSAFLGLVLAFPSPAQVRVKAPTSFEPYKKIVLKASDVTSSKASFLWDVDGECDVVEAGDTLYVWAAPGTYKVLLTAIDFESKKVERARFTFKVEGVIPPGPTPPGPTPPNPPTPIPTSGLTVLILFDKATELSMPKAQQDAIYDKSVRDYLNGKCAMGPDGKTKEWAIWDVKADTSNDPSTALKAMSARSHPQLPWIVISDGKTIYENALPADTASLLMLLKKWGG